MKNGLVVKDNALINASYNLEVTEQRLMGSSQETENIAR